MNEYLTERYLRLQDGTLPHMSVRGEGDVAEYVILCGNPARVERLNKYLDESVSVGSERGYVVYTGLYGDTRLTVASSGMGCPSMVVSVEELALTGGKTFIRAGSCASITPEAGIGDLIIATAAVRDEGTSPYYAPLSYPAVASHRVTHALSQTAEALGYGYHRGIIRSTDAFYEGERVTAIIDQWRKCQVLAFEMESSALFTVASVLGLQAGAICVPGTNLVANRSTYRGQDIDAYHAGEQRMLRVTLEAVVTLSKM